MALGGYSPQQQQLFQPYQIGSKGMQPLKKQSGFSKWAFGEKEQFQRSPLHTPQGMDVLEQLLSSGAQGLQDPQAGFQPIANQAVRQFQSQTVPGLAERFTALGGSGTRGQSSDFAGMLGGAGADLQSQLAAMSAEYGLQNRQGLLQQLQLGLQPQFETQHKDRGSGFLERFAQSLAGPQFSDAVKSYGNSFGKFGGGTTNAPIPGQNVVGNYSRIDKGGQGGGTGYGDMASFAMKLLPMLI